MADQHEEEIDLGLESAEVVTKYVEAGKLAESTFRCHSLVVDALTACAA